MFKSLAAGGVALFAAFIIQPGASQAGTNVDVSIAAFGYPSQYHPYHPVYHSPDYDDDYDDEDEDDYDYISCGQGRRIVRAHGFRRVQVLRCGGGIYRYRAIRRHRPWIVRLSARSGRIISVRPQRPYY